MNLAPGMLLCSPSFAGTTRSSNRRAYERIHVQVPPLQSRKLRGNESKKYYIHTGCLLDTHERGC